MTNVKLKLVILGLGLGLILFTLFIIPETAQGRGVSISPLIFELTANPGDVLENKLKVFNPTDALINVQMEVEDFTAAGEAGEVRLEEQIETYSLVKWVQTSPVFFTLEPNASQLVDFIINVPLNGEPGGHYGSILVSLGAESPEAGGSAIAQKVGALVLLTVAGEMREEMWVRELSSPGFSEYGPIKFDLRFQNIGTVHVRPKGFVSITNFWGKKIVDIEFPQKNVLPGSTRHVQADWSIKWLFGKYTATLVGNYGTSNIPISYVTTFWVMPWKIMSGIVLLLGLIFLFFYKTRRRFRAALRILFKGK